MGTRSSDSGTERMPAPEDVASAATMPPPDHAPDGPHPAERAGQDEYAFARFDEEVPGGHATETVRDDSYEVVDEPTVLVSNSDIPRLVCTAGKDAGLEYSLQVGDNSIGRAIENDVILSDLSVSRRHFVVVLRKDRVHLRDLGSGNGTTVNGLRAYDTKLNHGDAIKVGETVLELRFPQGSAAAQVAPPSEVSGAPVPERRPPPAPRRRPLPSKKAPTPPPAGVGQDTDPMQAKPDRGPGKGRRMRLILWIAAGIAVAVWAVVAVVGYVGRRKTEQGVSAQTTLAGFQAYKEERWKDAIAALKQVPEGAPEYEEAKKLLSMASRAEREEPVVRQIDRAMARGDFDVAKLKLERVSPRGPYGQKVEQWTRTINEREARVDEARRRELARLRADAGAPQAESRPEEATPNPVARAKSPKANSQRTSDVSRQILRDARRRRVVREVSRRSPPSSTSDSSKRRGSANESEVLKIYRAGDFETASDQARTLARRVPEPEKSSLNLLGQRIDRFAAAYSKAKSADGMGILEDLDTAVRADKKISGGHYGKKLEPRLRSSLVEASQYFLEKGRLDRACPYARRASKMRGNRSEVDALIDECEEGAVRLYKDASKLEASEPGEAQRLYRRVMRVAKRESSVYKKANRRLIDLAAR